MFDDPENTSGFVKFFEKSFGMTPEQFAKKNHANRSTIKTVGFHSVDDGGSDEESESDVGGSDDDAGSDDGFTPTYQKDENGRTFFENEHGYSITEDATRPGFGKRVFQAAGDTLGQVGSFVGGF
jgi:hypothetical protein